MPVRRSQGAPRPEVARPDELPRGVPGPDRAPDAPEERRPDGTFKPGAKRQQAAGGRGKRGRVKLAVKLPDVPPEVIKPYMADAKAYRRAVCGEYARDVGGGFIGPAASSVVATAALQLAMSRLYFALGDLREASRMGDASRANLLAAQEMCARSAMARGKRLPPRPDLGSTFGSG